MNTWHASLALDFRPEGEKTVLSRRHAGPLQVQKPLYPEGPAVCHALMIHPPGGIAGGDALCIDITAQAASHAVITTPGATKWYKANGRSAVQRVNLRVNGCLEWLPQEAIVFDQAQVDSQIDIELAPGAAMLGWDIVALGRAAAGETFRHGRFAQRIALRQQGALTWLERTRLDGDDGLLQSPVGLNGRHVFGCLWAAGPALNDALFDTLREQHPTVPLTRLTPQLWVARVLTDSTRLARQHLQALWCALRPQVLQRAAVAPRIWAT